MPRMESILAGNEEERSMAQRVAAGDRTQFEKIMRRYNQRLYRLARAALRDDAEAEDALQEAYLAAYRSMGRFRGESSLSTWLSRLVLNECLGRLRRSERRQRVMPIVSSALEINAVAGGDSDLPERIIARRQLRSLLESKLDELPESFRLVFVLRSVEEMSVRETARTLGIPEGTVRTRYHRARTLLRQALEQDIDRAARDLFEFDGERCDRVISKVKQQLAGNVSQPS
jgi:RNA polymerase sigma-70 factor (ECF subfamily)